MYLYLYLHITSLIKNNFVSYDSDVIRSGCDPCRCSVKWDGNPVAEPEISAAVWRAARQKEGNTRLSRRDIVLQVSTRLFTILKPMS